MIYYHIVDSDKHYGNWYPLHRVHEDGDYKGNIEVEVEGEWRGMGINKSIYNLYRYDVSIREITEEELNKYLLIEKLGK